MLFKVQTPREGSREPTPRIKRSLNPAGRVHAFLAPAVLHVMVFLTCDMIRGACQILPAAPPVLIASFTVTACFDRLTWRRLLFGHGQRLVVSSVRPGPPLRHGDGQRSPSRAPSTCGSGSDRRRWLRPLLLGFGLVPWLNPARRGRSRACSLLCDSRKL